MAEYNWPAMADRSWIGKRISRLDGPQKSGGRAKYGSDQNPAQLLYGAILTCPSAHAKINAIDTSAAKASPGVTAVITLEDAGKELQWEGTIVAAVAFDRTGTTRIGKYVVNHSFMLPGLVATVVAIVSGMAIAKIVM